MTFPTIQTTSQTDNAATTTHVITMPTGIQAGDLLLVFFATDGDNTITDWQTFIELDSQSNLLNAFGAIGYKIATGSDTLTITTSVLEPSSCIMYRIDGWESTFPPEISTVATGNDLYPNSTIVTPSWSQDDTLYISTQINDSSDLVSVYPTNYILSQINENGGANQDCGVAVCGRNYNNPSDDPPAYTLAGAEQWVAWTIAVAPSGATAPTEYYSGKGIDRGINRGIL